MKDASHNQDEDQNNRRVLIIDDHPLVRESLKKIIQKEPDLTVCGEAEDRDRVAEQRLDRRDLAAAAFEHPAQDLFGVVLELEQEALGEG